MNNQNNRPSADQQSRNSQPATEASQRQPQQQDSGNRQSTGSSAMDTRQAGYASGQQKQFEAGDADQFRSQVREHMDVIDANGDHFGKVDSIDGDRIKLTRNDSADGEHHYVEFDQVAGIEGGRLRLGETGQARNADANASDNNRR